MIVYKFPVRWRDEDSTVRAYLYFIEAHDNLLDFLLHNIASYQAPSSSEQLHQQPSRGYHYTCTPSRVSRIWSGSKLYVGYWIPIFIRFVSTVVGFLCVITFSAHVHLPPLSHSTTNSPRSQQGTTCSSVPFIPLPAYVVLHLRLSYVKEWALVLRLSFERPRVQQGVPLVIGCLFLSRFRLVFPLFGSPKVPLSSRTLGRKEERLV